MVTKAELNKLTYRIIGSAIEVHKHLGPGLLESVYHKCLKKEFILKELRCSTEFPVLVHYKGEDLDTELRCDFLVERMMVVEIKAVEAIAPFMKLSY